MIVNTKEFDELADMLSMAAFLEARKLPGITDALAYSVRDAVLREAKALRSVLMPGHHDVEKYFKDDPS